LPAGAEAGCTNTSGRYPEAVLVPDPVYANALPRKKGLTDWHLKMALELVEGEDTIKNPL